MIGIEVFLECGDLSPLSLVVRSFNSSQIGAGSVVSRGWDSYGANRSDWCLDVFIGSALRSVYELTATLTPNISLAALRPSGSTSGGGLREMANSIGRLEHARSIEKEESANTVVLFVPAGRACCRCGCLGGHAVSLPPADWTMNPSHSCIPSIFQPGIASNAGKLLGG